MYFNNILLKQNLYLINILLKNKIYKNILFIQLNKNNK